MGRAKRRRLVIVLLCVPFTANAGVAVGCDVWDELGALGQRADAARMSLGLGGEGGLPVGEMGDEVYRDSLRGIDGIGPKAAVLRNSNPNESVLGEQEENAELSDTTLHVLLLFLLAVAIYNVVFILIRWDKTAVTSSILVFAMYLMYETGVPAHAAIRVDLLLVWPVLFINGVGLLVVICRNLPADVDVDDRR